MAKILVVAESIGDEVQSPTLAAITMARQAASLVGGTFDILVIGGSGSGTVAHTLARYGGEKVLLTENAGLAPYLAELFVNTVADAARGYALVIAGSSHFGADLLPRVAGKLDAAFAGDCLGVDSCDGELAYRRSLYASNVYGYVRLTTATQVVTAQPCAFAAAQALDGWSPVQIFPESPPGAAAAQITRVGQPGKKNQRPRLTEAKVIVAGGRALKGRFFEMLEPLAEVLEAEIGATRLACDAGYAPSHLQVGQTGTVVAPSLYVAIGVSGAIQHLAGIRGAKTIVAINKDPKAPIFQFADFGLVANLFDVLPEIVQLLRARRLE